MMSTDPTPQAIRERALAWMRHYVEHLGNQSAGPELYLVRDLLAALAEREADIAGGKEAYRIQGEELLRHIRRVEAL